MLLYQMTWTPCPWGNETSGMHGGATGACILTILPAGMPAVSPGPPLPEDLEQPADAAKAMYENNKKKINTLFLISHHLQTEHYKLEFFLRLATSIRKNAFTIAGSNCDPALFLISSTAISWLKPSL